MPATFLSQTQLQRLNRLKETYPPEHENYKPLRMAEFLLGEGDYVRQENNLVIWPGRAHEITVNVSGQGDCTCGTPDKCAHRMLAWIIADPREMTPPAMPLGQKPSLTTLCQRFRQQAAATTPLVLPGKGGGPYFPWQTVQDAVEHVTGGHWSSRVTGMTSSESQALVAVCLTIHCLEGDTSRSAMGAAPLHPKTNEGKPIAKSEENAYHKADRKAFKRAASLFGFRLPDDD